MKTYQLILLLFIFLIPKSFIYGQSAYDYPIKPGTEEWKKLKNHEEKVKVCQIPDYILFSLSTEELLDVCLNYPLITDIMAFNNVQDGFNAFKTNFNGANELLQRDNFSDILLERYTKIEPSNYLSEWSNFEKGKYAYKIMVLEFFIAQDEVLNKLNQEKKKDLIKLLLLKKEEKNDRKVYDYHSIMSIYYPISKIILADEIDKTIINEEIISEILKFSKSGYMRSMHLIPYIDSIAFNFAK